MSLNHCVFSGRLGKDPEVRQAGSKSVAGFSLAVDEGFGDKKTTFWMYVEAWDKLAEAVSKLLGKGQRAAVMGRLKFEEWEQNGEKKSRWKLIADKVEVIDFPEKDDDKVPF